MTRHYSSFLIRYWRLGGDKQRIEIEHIQSGDWTRTGSLAAAITWMEIHEGGSTDGLQQSAPMDELVMPNKGRPANQVEVLSQQRQPGDAQHTEVEDA